MQFVKMNGAGNDFIILDNRDGRYSDADLSQIAKTVCHRHLSVGADGLMAVAKAEGTADFKMQFFNADGSLGERISLVEKLTPEMIASAGEGLYAASMGGGSVNPSTGEFNFAVSEGYLIKNGKLDTPVRGASLIGRGSEVLLKIDRVGRNMTMGQGMCGSMSGSVPTNVGQPTIRISSLTVGGREKE